MRSSRIAAILRSLESAGEPIHVQGATPAARAWIIARRVKAGGGPVVVLCRDDDSAADFAADLETLGLVLECRSISVCQFPTWDQSPYSASAPSIRTRLARAGSLGLLTSDGLSVPRASPEVLVTSLAALCQATVPKDLFLKLSIDLREQESVGSREALIARLLEAGYLRVDPVEDPGTFAARGEILDIFPPDRGTPIRIELFGDRVERIREFDPATQRASAEAAGTLRGVRIFPARESLINSQTTPRVRERLKARADDLGISRTVRDPILASVQSGIYPEHADAWVPFAFENPATLMDYLAPNTLFAWNDELSCMQDWDIFIAEQRRLSDEAANTEVIAPVPEELFRWTAELAKRIQCGARLFLDQVALASLDQLPASAPTSADDHGEISSHHQVLTLPNTDLTPGSRHSLGDLEPKFKLWIRQGFKIVALASTQTQLERIRFLLEERGLSCRLPGEGGPYPEPSVVTLRTGSISEGFRWPAEGVVIVNEGEILGTKRASTPRKSSVAESGSAAKDWAGLSALSDLAIDDAVVHIDHGIGRYRGLTRLDLSGAPSDFLQLEYANKDKLYLPVYRLNVIQKYVGAGENVALDRLGSQQFAKEKEKVRAAVKKLAIDLVQLYAERKIRPGIRFSRRDSLFREFEAKFPFDETPDQIKSTEDILGDLESGRVMDRLVCGDVGYGKTEVAIRAAFRAVSDGKQVAVLVPTTVLAYQHEQSFKARMKDYPILVESLSRFKTKKEQAKTLESLASGKIDIIVGTHRLLSRDVKFRDLGLVIVDEEHRFGVEHKERLKTIRVNTHVLTLTATPIPRTLHMALSGLRDISLINTPPVDRLPIRTYVSKFDEALIKRAIELELNRGGQVFFLHNRIQSIHEIAAKIRELVHTAQIGVAHGQMPEGELEKTMVAFYQKRTNVLICTSIIESGLDLPSANTILINRADALGLAQLYQIRGRVGRGQQRAYAYLLIPAEGAVTEDAKRRLEVIQRFVELGSGFSIANHDLEIRGGGDLLGPQQSGHIAAVGFDLYTELLEEAIRELRGKPLSPEESRREPEIKVPFPAFLSEKYIPDVHQRLSFYRRFSASEQDREIDLLEEELVDRYGPLPAEALNLLWLIRIKQLLKRSGIDALTAGPHRVSLVPGPHSKLDPVRAIALVSSDPKSFQLTPDSKFVAALPTEHLRDLFFGLEKLLKRL